MQPTDFVTALGQLLSNPALQSSFAVSPHAVADLLNVDNNDRALFTALSSQHIHAQAKLLITKRMREVHKYLPITFKEAGANIADIFADYAIHYWPSSYRRHQEDAYRFSQHLIQKRISYNKSEFNRIKFIYSQRRLKIAVANDAFMQGKKFPALQLFYKTKQTYGEWRLFLRA